MIRRKDEMETVIKHEVQEGMGGVASHTFMTEEEAYGSGRTFAKAVFEPSISIRIHEHQGEFEGCYVLKGQTLITNSGVESVLNPGDYHICKDGSSHDIVCYGDETMEITALIINVSAQRCREGYFERDIGPGYLFWKGCLDLVPGGQLCIPV